MTKIKTNDLKKGTEVRMRNGFSGTLMDNRKGNLRSVFIRGSEFGYFDEQGDNYSHNIVSALVNGEWVEIEYTESQLKCRAMVKGMGF